MAQASLFNKYIAGIYRQSKNEFNQQVAELDIRATEGDILLFVNDHPNVSQQRIAQEMVLDPSLVARDLRDLVARQLVTRQRDPKDGRAHLIALTPTGQQQAGEIRQVMATWWERLFEATPEADAQTTGTQLAAIYETLQQRLKGID
ncbi:MarR family winged helix-turn-helix transcriptional regulator [Lactiplantibacillus herbarum]|uniref:MarR family winged helix-turn-helix transcriptional regulator n=1 Tax=Lactiplantibacillus herbarum TaxID=1670446 RepID=UPI00064F1013|nr:MarR family winged helix-turn-helix transcriptional regulator [Lactiplantibacillus herbarum]